MPTTARLPLTSRVIPQPSVNDLPAASASFATSKIALGAGTSSTLAKRPRSPELKGSHAKVPASKRPKSNSPVDTRVEKDKRKADRDAMKEEFRIKYTKAFPSWTFYFDTTDAEKENLTNRVLQLDAVRPIYLFWISCKISYSIYYQRVAKFFSKDVTHFITNRAVPPQESTGDKENIPKQASSVPAANANLRTPIKLRELYVNCINAACL